MNNLDWVYYEDWGSYYAIDGDRLMFSPAFINGSRDTETFGEVEFDNIDADTVEPLQSIKKELKERK